MKEKLGAKDEIAQKRCMKAYKEEKREVKRCIYKIKMEVNE